MVFFGNFFTLDFFFSVFDIENLSEHIISLTSSHILQTSVDDSTNKHKPSIVLILIIYRQYKVP